MRSTIKKKFIQVISLVVLFVLTLSLFFNAVSVPKITYADTTASSLALDKTNVLDDLQNSSIDGKDFNLTDYAFTNTEETQVILFTEYCYSFYSNLQDNYALYVYVWNPQGIKYVLDSELNTINLRVGTDTSKLFNKYNLIYLNQSIEENVQGLFLKYKVNLTAEDKEYIFDNLNSLERFYRVAEIELLTDGATNATKVTVATDYTFSGFSAGYGSDSAAESTLISKQEETDEILDLKVYHTFYRSDGYSSDIKTQDTLHSVYFSVPNKFIERFGELTAVHARWLNALTAPIFVTGNQDIYNAVLPYLSQYVYGGKIEDSTFDTDLEYALIATKAYSDVRDTVEAAMGAYIAYNAYENYSSGTSDTNKGYDKFLYNLQYAFLAENGNADEYVLSSEKLLDWFSEYTALYGGELVNGKYSKALFDSVDETFIDINIQSNDSYTLTDITSSGNVWDWIFGTSDTYEKEYTMSAIQSIDFENDFNVGKEEFCDTFYISSGDYEHFYDFCESSNMNDKTVFLFRYKQTEYKSYEVTEYERVTDWALIGGDFNSYEVVDTNAYFAQTYVQLDFDVIDVTFSNGEIDTVIGVASSPIDVIPDVAPPIDTTSDDGLAWWQILLAIILVVVLLIILQATGILPIILKVVGFIILLPFRIIAWIVKGVKFLISKDKAQVAERKTSVKKQDYNRPKHYYQNNQVSRQKK